LLDAVERSWAGELVGVALFGSAARGDATAASDVDLLVVLEPGTRIERSLYDRWDEIVTSGGRRDDRRVSPQFVALPASASDAGGIWLEVAREGIVLGDRDRRLARFLIGLRDLVAEGAVSRKTVHGHPYWVREGRRR
jgi:predicted nucleotidyltransferase